MTMQPRSTDSMESHEPGHNAESAQNTLIGLRVLPGGPSYFFEDFVGDGGPKRILVIGSDPKCDIPLADSKVSQWHCILTLRGGRVHISDCNSKNGTRLDDKLIASAELADGSLLTLGNTTLMAFSASSMPDRPQITARTIIEFAEKAVVCYGSKRSAARAIGIPESTLRGWLKDEEE